MIQIEAVRAIIHTNSGVFGRTLEFKKGLNIVRADNTSGKSSLFGALLYGLGFEEILGGRNDKALQSVFKSIVKEIVNGQQVEHDVIQSEILLQFTNGEKSITTRRFVVNNQVKPQAVEVFYGELLTEENFEIERAPMYVHDAGAASNEDIGFHKFLEEFIGYQLPEIVNQDGKRVKMYLPLLASAHFIEQKVGWSDFYATIPFYGIRDAYAKVFEYILDFDVFEVAAKRQEVANELKDISDKWVDLHSNIIAIAKKGGSEVVGLPTSPQIINDDTRPYLRFIRGDKSYLLNEIIEKVNNDLELIKQELSSSNPTDMKSAEGEMLNLKNNTERYEILYDNLSSQINQDKELLRQYSQQLSNVEDDLRKNKDAEKIQAIGLSMDLKISSGICPTCNQNINNTLLNENVEILPMRIDDNISYLQSQKKMIMAFVDNLKKQVADKENKVAALEDAINKNRQRIRSIKRTLISDDRLPSEEKIEQKIIHERELSFLYKIRGEFEELLIKLSEIGLKYLQVKGSISGLYSNYLSPKDKLKFEYFENKFRSLLTKFGFTSKSINSIRISLEKYLPVYEFNSSNGVARQVDIRFETSASDYIRAIWAYYISLMKTSTENNGNHFGLLVFDEPQQQSAGNVNFKSFLQELESMNQQQSILFASFQNSDEIFSEEVSGLTEVNILDFATSNELIISRI